MNYIVANNIRSAFNVGSLFRIADSLNLGLVLQGITPYPRIPEDTRPGYYINRAESLIKKSGVKTLDFVNYSYINTLEELFNWKKDNSITFYSLEITDKSTDIFTLSSKDIVEPFALVLGNEVEGVDTQIIKRSKNTIHIPMWGKNPSLNVSVAAGIALYQLKFLK